MMMVMQMRLLLRLLESVMVRWAHHRMVRMMVLRLPVPVVLVMMQMVMMQMAVMRPRLPQPRIAVVRGEVQRQQLQIVVGRHGRELVQPLLARALRGNVGAAGRGHCGGFDADTIVPAASEFVPMGALLLLRSFAAMVADGSVPALRPVVADPAIGSSSSGSSKFSDRTEECADLVRVVPSVDGVVAAEVAPSLDCL
uniref:Uncharacterized protein n=1 Tax=Anopheles coluzzii TaxID=1518534 RepID=A0A8W7NZZ4_ANOCL